MYHLTDHVLREHVQFLRFSSLIGGRFDIDAMIDDDPPRKEHSVISIRVCIPQSLSDSMIGMLSILPKYV